MLWLLGYKGSLNAACGGLPTPGPGWGPTRVQIEGVASQNFSGAFVIVGFVDTWYKVQPQGDLFFRSLITAITQVL